jgi:hypothetical protein
VFHNHVITHSILTTKAISPSNNDTTVRYWWLTPVILASTHKDQEDHGSKPAWANSSVRSYLKKLFTKNRLVEWLKV